MTRRSSSSRSRRTIHSGSGNTWFDTVTAGGRPGGAVGSQHRALPRGSGFGEDEQRHVQRTCCSTPTRAAIWAATRTLSPWRARHALGYTDALIHKGGEDSTFTPTDQYGSWKLYSTTPNATIAAKRTWDAKYLYPLYRGFNTNTKGVIYVAGTIGISGVVRGDVTLYTPNTVVILDDIRYANDPAKGLCVDILGTISGQNTYVADNSINTPQIIKTGTSNVYRSMDDTPDLNLHAVIMALGTSFTVENYNSRSEQRAHMRDVDRRPRVSVPHRRPDSEQPWTRWVS